MAASLVEGPGLKGSRREVEAWHHEERLGEVIGESAAQLRQEAPSILEMPVLWDDHPGQPQPWMLSVWAEDSGAGEVTQALQWSSED